MDLAVNLADTTSRYFPKTWAGRPEPIKIAIIKWSPKLWRINGNWYLLQAFPFRYFRATHDSTKITSFKKISSFVSALFESWNVRILSSTNTLKQGSKVKFLALKLKGAKASSKTYKSLKRPVFSGGISFAKASFGKYKALIRPDFSGGIPFEKASFGKYKALYRPEYFGSISFAKTSIGIYKAGNRYD